MTDWPDDWFRESPGPDAQQPASGDGAGAPSGPDLTTRLPYPGSKQPASAGGREPVTAPRRSGASASPQSGYGGASYGAGAPAAGPAAAGAPGGSAWPSQPAPRTSGRPGGP